MEHLISRYRNLTILAALLFGQVLGLAIQVKRPGENVPTRLIRIWAIDAVTPLEKGIVWCQNGVRSLWHGYFYLRGVRQENRELKHKIEQLEIERVRLNEDAEQAHRLQALLGFREQFIAKTVAAQVIGSSGSEQSRSIYIDKGSRDGVRPDMAVITADGVVGKVLRGVQNHVASVLLIDDQTSGVGAILEKSRLQGVLRGTPAGEVVLEKVMTDESVQPGERVLTSGGDRIFPKGLPVGTVTKVSPGQELFLNIRVKPVADLGRLEEVLVITQLGEREPVVTDAQHLRAADILAQRLPSIPDQPTATNPYAPPPPTSGLKIAPAPTASTQVGSTGSPKPGETAAAPSASVVPKTRAASTVNLAKPANSSAAGNKPTTGVTNSKPTVAQKPTSTPAKVSPGPAAGRTESESAKSGAELVQPTAEPAPAKSEAQPAIPPSEAAPSPTQPPPQDQPH
ncbi:MAG TPA: rod shape-determining protein MreC [Terriglobales bacterium]|nr:rod shape-determining protein MreC [Terriglobales bacterium]